MITCDTAEVSLSLSLVFLLMEEYFQSLGEVANSGLALLFQNWESYFTGRPLPTPQAKIMLVICILKTQQHNTMVNSQVLASVRATCASEARVSVL